MIRRTLLLISIAGSLSVGPGLAQVSFNRILDADKEPQNWLTYSGTLQGLRYSSLTQITRDNVKKLQQQWVFQARSLEKFEATPLVVDGVLYTVQAPNDVVALDAATGRMFWMYSYVPSPAARPCCGRINRGLAILDDTLFMATIDAHLVAIDAKSGQPRWNVAVAKPESGYAMTLAPLVVKDKVIVGTAGGEYGIRGFIAAYEARTGKEAWRFHTIPGPGEPGHETWTGDSWKTGGGSLWVTGSYDPALNLTYWGTGNPGPDFNGDDRAGDNLYTDSVVALDADTGKLKWHYQFTPHDTMDLDSVHVPVLVDMNWRGTPRQLLLMANRNGFFYAFDRGTGRFLVGNPFIDKLTWATGFDEKGRPIKAIGIEPTPDGQKIYPSNHGATNFYSPSYSPRTGLYYVTAWDDYPGVFLKGPVQYTEGQRFTGPSPRATVGGRAEGPQINLRKQEEGYSALRAIDPNTGERKWEFKTTDVSDSGVLTTASDLAFWGGRDGYFYALDARSGELLWNASLGANIAMGPITYSVGGKQYVAIASGNSLFAFAFGE
jgi:alcohol dehydrogenase (cytochrome c)